MPTDTAHARSDWRGGDVQHAFVMTFLFRSGSVASKLRLVADLTRQHATNLCTFVALYKSLLLLLRKVHGDKERSADAFAAGVVGGFAVFGRDTSVNNQIVLYLLSRIAVGAAKLARERVAEHVPTPPPGRTFPLVAALTWGVVMWLFRHERHTLQGSLQASMQYLYNVRCGALAARPRAHAGRSPRAVGRRCAAALAHQSARRSPFAGL